MKKIIIISIIVLLSCFFVISISALSPECTDSDEDGYYYEAGCGTLRDCNDANASIRPESEEICNSYDDNCDGLVDEGCDTICDNPYTLSSDIRITWDSSISVLPSFVWSGSEYGISWDDERDGNNGEIYFARLDRLGNKIGSDVRVTWDSEISFYSSIAWTGKEYGIAWLDARNLQCGYFAIYFARLDASGNKISSDIRITPVFRIHSYHDPTPNLVWTGSEYAVSWQVYQDGNFDIYFTRFDPSGNKIGSDVRVARPIERISSNFPSLVWTGNGYGISWDEERDGNYEIYFARLDPSGNKIGSDVRVTWDTVVSYIPSLVWTGSEYGISWEVFQDGKKDIYFAHLDQLGNKIGSDLKVTLNPLNYSESSLVWTGSGYGISWNDSRSGAYEIYFRQIHCNQAPSVQAGEDSASECTSFSGAMTTLDGSASTDADSSPGTNDDIVAFEWFEYYGSPDQTLLGMGEILNVQLPLGEHIITLKVTDSAGQTDTDEVTKTVVDTIPPDISVSVKPDMLWPPDHRMMDIEATVIATDICGIPSIVLSSITNNEPDDAPGNGDGNTINDIQDANVGTADFNFKLRAERSGTGDGRIYTVKYTATDLSGNMSSTSSTVNVPHDKK